VVLGALDAVQRRVAQVDVGLAMSMLRAQHHRAVGMPAVAHLAQARQVISAGRVAKRAVHAGRVKSPRLARICSASARRRRPVRPDQAFGGAVHEVEVVLA
jgi:hypothetical protein